MVAESKNNIIVESLETLKRIPVHSTSKVSALEDIAIYTENGDVPLKDIFKAIYDKENGGAALASKVSANELKSYFVNVVPDYDKYRVYISDIKKYYCGIMRFSRKVYLVSPSKKMRKMVT